MGFLPFVVRWTVVTEMSASRSAAGVTVFDGRIFVSGGHDGLQIFNTVSFSVKTLIDTDQHHLFDSNNHWACEHE